MSRHARLLAPALAVAALVTVAVVPASAVPLMTPGYTKHCPRAESLVRGTRWHTHHIGPGVVLREGKHRDRTGFVRMHVLSVDVTNPHLQFRPLMRHIAHRQTLSSFNGRGKLIAATNAGYFDWRTGAPLGPTVQRGRPLLTTRASTWVVGFARDGLMQAGHLSAGGAVVAQSGVQTLAGLNSPRPGVGVTAYTPRWGRAHIVLPSHTFSRYVSQRGVVRSAARRFSSVPRSGFLLVARGHRGVHWLRSVHLKTHVLLRRGIRTDVWQPFRLAYAVGGRIVANGRGLTHLSCPRRYPKPARTAIGFADGGRRLLLISVDDNLRTPLHGLDANQLGRVMADLGAQQAFLFDGGGSTTMLTRMRRGGRLSLRTHTAERYQRAVPLGFGIYRR